MSVAEDATGSIPVSANLGILRTLGLMHTEASAFSELQQSTGIWVNTPAQRIQAHDRCKCLVCASVLITHIPPKLCLGAKGFFKPAPAANARNVEQDCASLAGVKQTVFTS